MAVISSKKQFTLYVVLIAAIIVVINLISRSLFFRIDLTENNMYSLSNSSKSVLEKLDDRILARVFFSKDLPGQYANSRRYLQDLLEEYQAYSRGKFHFEFVNPDANQEAQDEAHKYGIPPVQMQVLESDKLEVKNVYMGMVLIYNDKTEVLPVIQTTEGLEYDITAAIKKISETDLKNVAIISPENDRVSTQNLQNLLRQTYRVRNISLDVKIPLDIDVVLMNGVKDSLEQEQLYNLDQFLMRGGKLFIGQGKSDANLEEGYAAEIRSNIFDFLEHYGIKIGRDMLIDKNCGHIQIQQRRGFFSFSSAVEYPAFVVVHNFNKGNLIVKDLEEVRAFFVHETSQSDSTIIFIPLMYTSDKTGSITPGMVPRQMYGSYTMSEGYNITPHIEKAQMLNPAMTSFPLSRKAISALVEGEMTSYFADSSNFNQKEDFLSRSTNAQILLITDNEFFNDYRAGSITENTEFILNGIDYLVGDRELLEIRSREVTARPLKQLSDGTRRFWKWLNIILPALLVLIMGLVYMKRKSNKRKSLEDLYD